ncbi:MAG: ABC-F family ATP-binding cassette domain-containing protein [Acutalibacteraceae bacterium]
MSRLLVNNLKKTFGDDLLFDHVSFEVADTDRIGVVGVNGSGKTTLFRILIDQTSCDSGDIAFGKETQIGYMEQHVCKNLETTAYDEVLTVFSALARAERELESLRIRMQHCTGDVLSGLIEEQTLLRERFERDGGLTFRARARSAMLGLGFTEEQLSLRVGVLSGGQKAKLQLAKMLLSGANLLLLDEPTNHLDIDSVEWLEDFLRSYSGAFLVISHDRYFLDRITTRTFEMENHHLTVYNGNYTRHLALKQEARIAAERRYSNTRKEIGRLQGIIAQQKQWNQERNYRIIASKQKVIDRLEGTLEKPEDEPDTFHFQFTQRRVSGNDVLTVKELALEFGGKPIFSGVSMHVQRGERIFLLGPNGCGKTSLLKVLLGEYAASAGSFRLGAGVETGYYDQIQQGIPTDKTVIDAFWDDDPTMTETQVRSALAIFLFRGDDVFKPVAALSGGERARLLLLKLMLSHANFLLLDEPTNHLDIVSREALENALEQYPGTLLIVSHDRYLINKTADRIYDLHPDGAVEFIGNYDDYLEKKKATSTTEKPTQKSESRGGEYRQKKEQEALLRKKKSRLQKLEESIAAAEDTVSTLESQYADPEIATDYERMLQLNEQVSQAKCSLDELYNEWVALNEELSGEE